MGEDLVHFAWTVAEAGYRWVQKRWQSAAKSELLLTSGVAVGEVFYRKEYLPLTETGLFRTFAEIKPSEEGILEFANKYGLLGVGMLIGVKPGRRPGAELAGGGEAIEEWQGEIKSMNEMVSLWDLALANDARLSQFIKWASENGGVYYQGPPIPGLKPPQNHSRSWIAMAHEVEKLERFPGRDLVVPAFDYIQKGVNSKLLEHKVTARLLRNRTGKLGLYLVPTSLIGCLWLQFARAIDGDRQYRRCQDCRMWFELSPRVNRADRQFCTGTCKANAHRKKIDRARELSAQGISPREIAKRLDTTAERVRGWLPK